MYNTLDRGSGAQHMYNTLDRGSNALYQVPLEHDTAQARTNGAVANESYATFESSNAQRHAANPRLADNPIYVGPVDSDAANPRLADNPIYVGPTDSDGDAETHA